jgi:hypothetical protein
MPEDANEKLRHQKFFNCTIFLPVWDHIKYFRKFGESSQMSVVSPKTFELIPDQISALCEWYDMWTYKQAEIEQ